MTWKIAQAEWVKFLGDIDLARSAVKASYRIAWFRGHADSRWLLIPSLYRGPRGDRGDQLRIIHLQSQIDEANDGIGARNQSTAFRMVHSVRELKQLSLAELKVRRRHLGAALPRNPKALLVNSVAEAAGTQAEFRVIQEEIERRSLTIREASRQIQRLQLLQPGEREAFADYSFRSNQQHRSSWETLAEMRHHGIPTRLLDWTEVLAVAVYFALDNYRAVLEQHWRAAKERIFVDITLEATPVVWVMNPFVASRLATRRTRIWNLAFDDRYDYSKNFLGRKEWYWTQAVPMYSPWQHQRLAAQHGVFTLFGYSRQPLEEQLPRSVLTRVQLTPLAALYGVKHLIEFAGLDRYSLFRDLDALGQRITEDYLRI